MKNFRAFADNRKRVELEHEQENFLSFFSARTSLFINNLAPARTKKKVL